MRIKGKSPTPPRPVTVTIYREDENGSPANFVFTCGAVLDFSKYEELNPRPKAPLITPRGGTPYHDENDGKYKLRLDAWGDLKVKWLAFQSLKATDGLEWETVNDNDPQTWKNFETELKTFLTEGEYTRLFNAILDANSPTQNRRSEAMDVFTESQPGEVGSAIPSQQGEPTTTTSSVPANG